MSGKDTNTEEIKAYAETDIQTGQVLAYARSLIGIGCVFPADMGEGIGSKDYIPHIGMAARDIKRKEVITFRLGENTNDVIYTPSTVKRIEPVENKSNVVCVRCRSNNLISFADVDTGKPALYICRDCRRMFTPDDIEAR